MWRTFHEVSDDNITFIAGGVVFAGVAAMFPAMAAFVSLYGLFADVATARDHLAILSGVVPAEALGLLGDQLVRIAAERDASLGLAFFVSLVLSIWSANAGMKALINGLNIAYDERETRNFLRLNLISLGFTVGAVAFLALAAAAVVAMPVALGFLRLDPEALHLAGLRWPALWLLTMLGLSALYRYGPAREDARWRWVTPGGALAAAAWLVVSIAFSVYVSRFGSFNATYGSLGAMFGFLTWLWLSVLVVLFGAELNSEIEHQTAVDSTTGAPLPMGLRGAVMADTVGRARRGPLVALPAWPRRRPAPAGASSPRPRI